LKPTTTTGFPFVACCELIESTTDTTNYFRWFVYRQDPPGDQRRLPAEQRMNQTNPSQVSLGYLYNNVLGQFPNLNSMTTYTAVFEASTGSFACITRNN
jgi:hypothetical protein